MFVVVRAGLGTCAPLLRVPGSARIVTATVLSSIGQGVWLLVGRVRRLLVARLLVGGVWLRPLGGGCRISLVSVPVLIALPDRSTSICTVLYVDALILMIGWPVVDLAVRPVIRIPVQMSASVARQDVLVIVNDDDPEDRSNDHRGHCHDQGRRRIEAGVRSVFGMIVVLIVLPIVRIPIVSAIRTVHDEIKESRDDHCPQNDAPDGDRRDLHGGLHELSLGDAHPGQSEGWDQNDTEHKSQWCSHWRDLLDSVSTHR
jgi:hypothetical protein